MTDATPQTDAAGTFHLVYRSRSRIHSEGRKQALGELFAGARSHNKRLHVTGALLCSGDCFVQVLEGDEKVVRDLFELIASDPRHDSVDLLDAGPVEARAFSRWAMAEVGEEGSPDIPLIAHRDGISPAAGRRTTPEQERMLEVMRAAARGVAPSV
jgi:hypothetical protein